MDKVFPLFTKAAKFFVLFGFYSFFILQGCKKGNNPTVHFIQPAFDIQFANDTTLTIEVDASDIDGDLESVSLFENDSLLVSFNGIPFRYNWPVNVALIHGNFWLKAVAFDKKGGFAMDSVNLDIADFRLNFIGNFNFKVMRENYLFATYHTFDTFYNVGYIRTFEEDDLLNDHFYGSKPQENTADKITIAFEPGSSILTSKLTQDGRLINSENFYYVHYGQFYGTDSIFFEISSIHSSSSLNYYKVYGKRLQ